MVRIRRFNVIKTATVVALIYVVIVAVFAIPFVLLVGVAGVSMGGSPEVGAGIVGILVFAVVIALFYGLLGWIVTAIGCAIYNLVAGWIGGIEVEVERVEPPAPPPAWMTSGTGSPAPPAAPPPTAPAP